MQDENRKTIETAAAQRPISTSALRGDLLRDWVDWEWAKNMEALTTSVQALLEKMREGEGSPLRIGVNLLWTEAAAAAERLGFDTNRKGWMKLVDKESNFYPHTQAGYPEELWQLVPTAARARVRAVAADAKLTQGRRLKIDPPRRGVLRSGGPYAGGGGSGGDQGLETAGQEHS